MWPENQSMIKSGLAFHCHHDMLYEWVTDYDARVEYIKHVKPVEEQELRLRLFRMIPSNRLPPLLVEAGAVYVNAWVAYNRARATYRLPPLLVEAWAVYDNDIKALHSELCPNCPWDGHTIFPKAKN